jgi:uncharacterized protein Smg (DUF494 family)
MKALHERIVEIITFVLTELREDKRIADIDVDNLKDKGYNSSEISTAFSWLVDRIEFSGSMFDEKTFSETDSFRILHEAERNLFTEKAWGQLIQMHSLGIIDNSHIESIIEKSLLSSTFSIDTTQLNKFVASTIFGAGNSSMPGSRVMLKGNETIN